MGYTKRNGQFAPTADVVLVAPGNQVKANGHGPALELGDQRVVRLSRVVTEAEGISPTLDVTVETSPDGSDDSWYESGAFTQATAPGSERKVFACDRFVRAAYTVGGTDATESDVVARDGDGPDVTVDGDALADFHGEIEIQDGGVRGVATFRWSRDGGSTWIESDVPTAANVALGDTGITAHFAAETAGSNGSVTHLNGSDPGTGPTVTPGGAPVEADDIFIEITTGGARGTAVFRWSKDGGSTWVASGVTVPSSGSYTLGSTGATAGFAAGTYVLGDTYEWSTTAPIVYVEATTYTWTSDNPETDSAITFGVTGESAGRRGG